MFERFTDRARQSVILSQNIAREMGADHISTGHILLSLLQEGEGVAAQALTQLDITLEAVRKQVDEEFPDRSDRTSGHIPYNAQAKRVLDYALREALRLGHNYIGTEHILLGIIREGNPTFAFKVLERSVDGGTHTIYMKVIELLDGYARSETPETTPPKGRYAQLRNSLVDIRQQVDTLIENVDKLQDKD